MEDKEDPKQCRICLQDETEDASEFMNPCKCKGSQKYIHKKCFNDWMIKGVNPRSLTHCPTCHYEYKRQLKDGGHEVNIYFALFNELVRQLSIAVISVILGSIIGYQSEWFVSNFGASIYPSTLSS